MILLSDLNWMDTPFMFYNTFLIKLFRPLYSSGGSFWHCSKGNTFYDVLFDSLEEKKPYTNRITLFNDLDSILLFN